MSGLRTLRLTTPLERALEPFAGGGELAAVHQVERIFRTGAFDEWPHPSEILATRSEPRHRLGGLYEEMLEKDPMLAGLVEKRVNAVTGLPRVIEPTDSSDEAVRIGDFVRQALSLIPSRVLNIKHQLGGVFRGVAFDELLWERLSRGPLAGAWVPVDLIDRPMHRFVFNRRGRLHVRRPDRKHLAAPVGKFLVFRSGTKDNPWGKALADRVYWPWFITKHAWKFYALFIERFASPLVKGQYRHRSGSSDEAKAANEEDVRTLLEAIEVLKGGAGLVLPEGLLLELLEASRGGDAGYERFVQLWQRAVSVLILGEVDTSGLAKGPGSFAKNKISNDVRQEVVRDDAHLYGSHETDTLVRWLVELNYGLDAPRPRSVLVAVDNEDREQRRAGIEMALRHGEPVPRSYFRMTLQIPAARVGEAVVEGDRGGPHPQPLSQPALPHPRERGVAQRSGLTREDRGARDSPLSRGGGGVGWERGARGVRAYLVDGEPSATPSTAAGVSADLDTVAAEFAPETLAYYQRQQELFLEAWDGGHIAAGHGLTWVAERLTPVSHAMALQAAGLHGAGLAFRQLQDEGLPVRLWRRPGREEAPLDLPLTAPADRRLAFQTPPGLGGARTPGAVIDFWTRVLAIGRDVFDLLVDEHRRFAFTVAGLQDASVLTQAGDLVETALAEGWGRERFVEALAELYAAIGLAPTADWHAQLVYQNNVRQANGAVRWLNLVENPAAHRLFPYLVFETLGDRRVRERSQHNHRVMDGRIFAIAHAVWRTWWFPAGHGCRCGITSISRVEAERRALTGAEPTGPWPRDPLTGGLALPDPGFRGAPTLARATEVAATQLRERTREARSSEDLLRALMLLRRLLGLVDRDGGVA